MTPAFKRALAFTLRWEGKFVDHPKDPGGATNRGITQRTYDAWRIRSGLKMRSVRSLETAELEAIYFDRYWLHYRCDFLLGPVDLVHFDNAVLLARPTELLQAAADRKAELVTDGVLGPKTLAAVNAWNAFDLAPVLAAARLGYHVQSLTLRDNRAFIEGWINRAHDLLRVAKGG